VLDRIETDLEGCEPRLRSMFAIFARLTRDDGAPRTESLRPKARRLLWTSPDGKLTGTLHALIAIPVIAGLVALSVCLAIASSTAHSCAPTWAHGAARTASCQSAQQSPARP
jgi:hypothetical protein